MLLPPPEACYDSMDELVEAAIAWSEPQGYAITKRRTKQNKKDPTIKTHVYLMCDMGRKADSRAPLCRKRKGSTSRALQCPFSCVGKLLSTGEWKLTVRTARHNHEAFQAASHVIHRKRQIDDDIRRTIQHQSQAGSRPAQVINSLQLHRPNIMCTAQDIYNIKQNIKRQKLGCLTPIQALIQHLDSSDSWGYAYAIDQSNHVTHLYCIHEESRRLIKRYPNSLVLDCTYKTNRYKMPLLNVLGTTGTNKSFYACFAFLEGETTQDYVWVLEKISAVFTSLDLPPPPVLTTDMEPAVIAAIAEVFPPPQTRHLLCQWHMNKNILANCRPDFESKEGYEEFFSAWQRCIWSKSEAEFGANWLAFEAAYRGAYEDGINYIRDTYKPHTSALAAFGTNQVMHLGAIVTSRSEGGHAALKRVLQVSTGDLQKVVDDFGLLITKQTKAHYLEVDSQKAAPQQRHKIAFFATTVTTITHFALQKAFEQLEVVVNADAEGQGLPPCTGVFSGTLGIPCRHLIQERLRSDMILMPDDFHRQWVRESLFISFN